MSNSTMIQAITARLKLYCGMLLYSLLLLNTGILSAAEFNIVEDGQSWFRYLDFQNKFQYSAVDYKFGEVKVNSASGETRVNLTDWDAPGLTLQNSGEQGDQNDLTAQARTEAFTLPDEDNIEISFYRKLGMWAPSNAFPPAPDDPPGGGPGTTPWDVLDKSEWEVQLRDATDHSVITSLDKVGIDAHSDPYAYPRYGTDAELVKIVRALPAGLGGSQVYLQIVPRRWGPTPYGMSLMMDPPHWVNLSALVDARGNSLAPTTITTIRQDWFDAVMQYATTVKQHNGWLPQRSWLFWDNEQAIYSQTFFEDQMINGKMCRVEIPPPPGSTGRVTVGNSLNNSKTTIVVHAASLQSLSPNPLSGPTLTVTTGGYRQAEIRLELVDLGGRSFGQVWSGTNPKGGQEITLNLAALNLANGSYMLLLKNSNGDKIAARNITIQR